MPCIGPGRWPVNSCQCRRGPVAWCSCAPRAHRRLLRRARDPVQPTPSAPPARSVRCRLRRHTRADPGRRRGAGRGRPAAGKLGCGRVGWSAAGPYRRVHPAHLDDDAADRPRRALPALDAAGLLPRCVRSVLACSCATPGAADQHAHGAGPVVLAGAGRVAWALLP
ncbi:hypothetical protein HBB16_06275 [Pseudonocardia sp. MCCB 268]|nr:hypothetical protein [Pseudonocardia cytotoxica]